MRILSLFDGISCGQIALHRAGIKVDTYYASEIEQSSIRVTQNNYPNTIQIGDVTEITNEFLDSIMPIDILIGGSPCQSLSIAMANRQHLDGKSKLFFDFVRILKYVKPKYWLLENVASMTDESMKTMSSHLGCYPIMIDSEDFSAQSRKRYYWTNIPINPYGTNKTVIRDILLPESAVDEKYYYDDSLITDVDMTKPICAMLDFKFRYDIIKRVQNPDFKCSTLICCNGGQLQKKVLINNRCRKLTPIEYERLQTIPDNYTAGIADTHRYSAIGNAWTVDVISHILQGIKYADSNAIYCEKYTKPNTLF